MINRRGDTFIISYYRCGGLIIQYIYRIVYVLARVKVERES